MSAGLRPRAVFVARIILRTLLAAVGFSGLFLQFFESENLIETLAYYTIQSNILCVIFIAAALIFELMGKPMQGRAYRIVKCALTMCITVTFLVYHFMLAPRFAAEGVSLKTSYNIILHYTFPLGMLADWLLFDKKGEIAPTEPLYWAAAPLLYPVFTLAYTALGGRYLGGTAKAPYFFLDVSLYGVGGVLLWILAIAAGFFALSYLFFGLDRLLGKITKSQNQ